MWRLCRLGCLVVVEVGLRAELEGLKRDFAVAVEAALAGSD